MVTIEELTLYICGILLTVCVVALKIVPTYLSNRKKRYIQPPRGKK